MKIELEDWVLELEASSEGDARRKVVRALRTAGIRVRRQELTISVYCARCKYSHSGDCATI